MSIDTGEFAITKDLQTVLGDLRWVKFINRAVEGFLALRNRSDDLIPFGTASWAFCLYFVSLAFRYTLLLWKCGKTRRREYENSSIAPSRAFSHSYRSVWLSFRVFVVILETKSLQDSDSLGNVYLGG